MADNEPVATCDSNESVNRTLCLQGRVISGHKNALDEAQRAAAAKGALKAVPLAVSGAFHTPLMKPAQEDLLKVRPHQR